MVNIEKYRKYYIIYRSKKVKVNKINIIEKGVENAYIRYNRRIYKRVI